MAKFLFDIPKTELEMIVGCLKENDVETTVQELRQKLKDSTEVVARIIDDLHNEGCSSDGTLDYVTELYDPGWMWPMRFSFRKH